MNDLVALVALSQVPGLGGSRLRRLLEHFGDLGAILAAPEDALRAVSGIGPYIAAAIQAADVDQARRDVAFWQGEDINVLDWGHLAYPARLRALPDGPPVLFCRGDLACIMAADARTVGIVGSRGAAYDSLQLARQMGYELAQRGWTVVSGLAWGIDFAAHNGAAQAGPTVAVLGSGLLTPLPTRKATLAEQIVTSGALLSEV
ncbi:MAG: DNA-protecting protein DprA, partial [Anaerolineae bacterium]|nr:DNA-protecting protein DprA [Anaerolineae bacterium]